MPVQGELSTWQNLQPNSGPNSAFYQFCDALEVKNGVSAPASGWGLDYALPAWGNYFKTVTLPDSKILTSFAPLRLLTEPVSLFWLLGCPDVDVETCLGTYNPDDAFWTDTKVDK